MRTRRYLIMMLIRVVCFVLMAVVTPHGWYTWLFAAGAIFIPYIAVVLANVSNSPRPGAEAPVRALPGGAPQHQTPTSQSASVFQVSESPSRADAPEL